MDELDVKILRALMSEGAVAPSDTQARSSLRSIAARLGADDMTVNYRYKRLMESRALSTWQLSDDEFAAIDQVSSLGERPT